MSPSGHPNDPDHHAQHEAFAVSSGLVYSTGAGRMCPDCRRPVGACACRAVRAPLAVNGGGVRVALDTKGRHGKAVTVVRGVPLDDAALAEFGKALRTACGCGGTTKAGAIELQGDHVARAIAALQARGWTVKRSG